MPASALRTSFFTIPALKRRRFHLKVALVAALPALFLPFPFFTKPGVSAAGATATAAEVFGTDSRSDTGTVQAPSVLKFTRRLWCVHKRLTTSCQGTAHSRRRNTISRLERKTRASLFCSSGRVAVKRCWLEFGSVRVLCFSRSSNLL